MDEFIGTVLPQPSFPGISGYKQVINRFLQMLKSFEVGFQVMAVPGFALGQGRGVSPKPAVILENGPDYCRRLIGAGEETFHQKERVYGKTKFHNYCFFFLGVLTGTAYLT
jgi:hypothetical protein